VSAKFSQDGQKIYTISRDGTVQVWFPASFGEEKEEAFSLAHARKWKLENRFFERSFGKLISCSFHQPSGLLILGFSSGVFGLYEMPDFNMIHNLRYSLFLIALAKPS